jgi:cytochrome P450
MRAGLRLVDRELYAAIRARRTAGTSAGRADVLSLLLEARDEDGQPLSDEHVRDELISLVLAGHETTANSLAWTFERLLRAPAAYDQLREIVRSGHADADDFIEATIHEGMRLRPVVPIVVRMVKRPWQLGDYVVPPRTPVAISILALHHRDDLYPDPQLFRLDRFLRHKPGTYTWIPFGGGIRRCLGASLAMAEQRVVLEAIIRRTDLAAPSAAAERARQRNVTMIPSRGGRVVVERKH